MKLMTAAALLCSALLPQLQADESVSYERIAEPMAPRNIQVLLEKDA